MEIAQFHLNYLIFNMRIFFFAAFLAVATAGAVYQKTPNPYNTGYSQNNDGYYSSSYDQVPTPYHFAYEVKDAATYNDYGQQESSDGYGNVKGSYHVLLPDGRTQTVTYTADAYGYHPIVRYTGGYQYATAYTPASYGGASSYPTPTPSYMNQYPSTYPTTSYKAQYPPAHSYPAPPMKNNYPKANQY